jgi:serine phosphatase RsbU (regulator of sigma subunit)
VDPKHTVVATHATLAEALGLQDEQRSYLVVLREEEPEVRCPIDVEPLTVGRDPVRDIVLADDQVSRLHLQVALAGGEVVVEDLGSSNGTYFDGRRIVAPTVLPAGRWVKVGSRRLLHERRSPREVARDEELAREIERATNYVRAQLPAPVRSGPIRTDWCHRPCTRLGGDAFSYGVLDEDHVVACLIDVSGHGVGAAMHSVSVLNVLRQRALPGTDFRDPAQVLCNLNAMFPMEAHDGMFLTIWYGVYSAAERVLSFATGGHHAGYLYAPGEPGRPLRTRGPMIGAIPGYGYTSDRVSVPSGAVLYLFSDGAFEITDLTERPWGIGDFLPLLGTSDAGSVGEAERIYQRVRARARPGPLGDDLSILVVAYD